MGAALQILASKKSGHFYFGESGHFHFGMTGLGRLRGITMLIHSDRLRGELFQRLVFTATTARVRFPSRVKEAGTVFRERVVLFVKDLDLFSSLCIARLILWRRTRRKH